MNTIIDDKALLLLPQLAVAVGVNEAIFLQQLHYLMNCEDKGRVINGQKWIHNTITEWQEHNFPFWDEGVIKRTIKNLENDGLVISSPAHNKLNIDRTKWYTINYTILYALDEPVERIKNKRSKRSGAANQRVSFTTRKEQNVLMGGEQNVPMDRTKCSFPLEQNVPSNTKEDHTKNTNKDSSGGGFAADLPEIINAMDERGYPPLDNGQLKAIYDALAVPVNETPLMWFEYVLDRNQQIGDKSLDCLTLVFEGINTVGSLAKFKQSDSKVKQGEHPAIEAYKMATDYYPRRNCWKDIISTVGNDPEDVNRWGQAVAAWKLAGYKFDNYQGMFDWFANGVPDKDKATKTPSTVNQLVKQTAKNSNYQGLF